ncbi:MAG: RNA polymerase sigma factor [Clostridia bacterium]|nr:RNA polymerase sigma factor [Clostridia bacterium]
MDAEHQNILDHYDALARMARARCTSQTDAEDLVADTMLAAFSYLHRGGVIEHPKTWLANTMVHLHNSSLRRKYRTPLVVGLEALGDMADEDDEEAAYARSEEAAEVRRVLNNLASTARSVLIRYYYNGQSVAEIAAALGLPEGTVKSRLYAGRAQVKKGLEKMENKKNHIAGRLYVSWSGSDGPNGSPTTLVENDLIAQNLLILAYDKPVTMCELAEMIGVPTVYVEPIVQRLVDGELMVHTEGDRFYTDFVIFKPRTAARALIRSLLL